MFNNTYLKFSANSFSEEELNEGSTISIYCFFLISQAYSDHIPQEDAHKTTDKPTQVHMTLSLEVKLAKRKRMW